MWDSLFFFHDGGLNDRVFSYDLKVPLLTAVCESVSQLRLVNQGQHDLQKICGMALAFEKGSFDSSPDKVSQASFRVTQEPHPPCQTPR
jgi:hypothetical protein